MTHDLDLTAVDVLLRRREELVAVLCEVATHRAAADELRRSVRALAGAAAELARWRPARQPRLVVFMPSNNVLYSYVLFGLIPLLYCDRIVMRPSRRVAAVTAAVHRIIAGDPAMPAPAPIELSPASQREFLAELRPADVVIFTGRPENAAQIAARSAHGTLLTFGSGTNPVVVGPDADLDVALTEVMAARLYNSGQDCLCPDVILVHGDVLTDFVCRLCDAAARLVLGPRTDPRTDVAPLTYHDVAPAVRAFQTHEHDRLARRDHLCGGVRPDRDRVDQPGRRGAGRSRDHAGSRRDRRRARLLRRGLRHRLERHLPADGHDADRRRAQAHRTVRVPRHLVGQEGPGPPVPDHGDPDRGHRCGVGRP